MKTLRWRASRAKGGTWWPTVVSVLTSIHDPETMKRLHIPLTMNDNENGTLKKFHLDVLSKYVALCIEIASARCWSQCQHTICLPNAFAMVHHESLDARDRALNMVKNLWNAILHAEEVLQKPDLDAELKLALKQVLDHCAWHKGQVAKELFLVCRLGNWQATDPEIRKLGWFLFGNPANTKHFLEDTFAHLADVVKRISRNFKLSKTLCREK